MKKRIFKPGTMLNPVPAVMVSCGRGQTNNIITIAWTGIINSDPPLTYISVRKERFSYDIINETKEFVINLTGEKLAFATDYCGVRSGRDIDKFRELNLTPVKSNSVSCCSIGESPVNLECKVLETRSYPTHEMFVSEIVSVSVDEGLIDEKDRICMEEADLIAFNHGRYYKLIKEEIGHFGYSVRKKSRKKPDKTRKTPPFAGKDRECR